MTVREPGRSQTFDDLAEEYDAALEQGISVSGEDRSYFARGRVDWLHRRVAETGAAISAVMDFGCGTGASVQLLRDRFGASRVLGVDTSARSLEIAAVTHAGSGIEFELAPAFEPENTFDLAFCNGVFHHIAPADRGAAIAYVHRALKPGGLFGLWENNPWNLGTRLVMSRIPFDRDAITLSSIEARQRLRAAGFEILGTDYLFIFPRLLAWLRRIEPTLARIPAGAQYLVFCRKPSLGPNQEESRRRK